MWEMITFESIPSTFANSEKSSSLSSMSSSVYR